MHLPLKVPLAMGSGAGELEEQGGGGFRCYRRGDGLNHRAGCVEEPG